MKSRKYGAYLVIRLEKDEEIISTLTGAMRSQDIRGGFFYGLGVGKNLELGYFDARKSVYKKKEFKGEYEFTSFLGNISIVDEAPSIHCHVTITDDEFNAHGGHLFRGTVPATLEVFVFPFTEPLDRRKDDSTGLNLLHLE
jgi:predicted DNA-binding protein with PD1-like motif